MDLTEAEDIKVARIHRRTIQKKSNDPDNHNGVITHLQQTSWKAKSHGPEEASL